MFDIIYENDQMVVVNKPAGLLSIPDREGSEISLKEILKNRYGNIFTVHRLDRETSGVIVFAKDEASHKFLSFCLNTDHYISFHRTWLPGTSLSLLSSGKRRRPSLTLSSPR